MEPKSEGVSMPTREATDKCWACDIPIESCGKTGWIHTKGTDDDYDHEPHPVGKKSNDVSAAPPGVRGDRESLETTAARLPRSLTRDEAHVSVLRRWTTVLPLRHQGVLMTAIRGCDGAPKEDSSKTLSRMIRRAILNPADQRETLNGGGFFGFKPEKLVEDVIAFLHSLDQYPLHYVMHMCHASEVIGYKHPEKEFRDFFAVVYQMMVYTFHLMPESEAQMDHRLTLDRVAAGTTERNF